MKRTYNSLFSYYLTGLIEGDGSIYVPKNTSLGYSAKLEISFHAKDLP
jgi:hypothetical protein